MKNEKSKYILKENENGTSEINIDQICQDWDDRFCVYSIEDEFGEGEITYYFFPIEKDGPERYIVDTPISEKDLNEIVSRLNLICMMSDGMSSYRAYRTMGYLKSEIERFKNKISEMNERTSSLKPYNPKNNKIDHTSKEYEESLDVHERNIYDYKEHLDYLENSLKAVLGIFNPITFSGRKELTETTRKEIENSKYVIKIKEDELPMINIDMICNDWNKRFCIAQDPEHYAFTIRPEDKKEKKYVLNTYISKEDAKEIISRLDLIYVRLHIYNDTGVYHTRKYVKKLKKKLYQKVCEQKSKYQHIHNAMKSCKHALLGIGGEGTLFPVRLRQDKLYEEKDCSQTFLEHYKSREMLDLNGGIYITDSYGRDQIMYPDGTLEVHDYDDDEVDPFPVLFKGKSFYEKDCSDVFLSYYNVRESLNMEGGVYMAEGLYVYPDGSMGKW